VGGPNMPPGAGPWPRSPDLFLARRPVVGPNDHRTEGGRRGLIVDTPRPRGPPFPRPRFLAISRSAAGPCGELGLVCPRYGPRPLSSASAALGPPGPSRPEIGGRAGVPPQDHGALQDLIGGPAPRKVARVGWETRISRKHGLGAGGGRPCPGCGLPGPQPPPGPGRPAARGNRRPRQSWERAWPCLGGRGGDPPVHRPINPGERTKPRRAARNRPCLRTCLDEIPPAKLGQSPTQEACVGSAHVHPPPRLAPLIHQGPAPGPEFWLFPVGSAGTQGPANPRPFRGIDSLAAARGSAGRRRFRAPNRGQGVRADNVMYFRGTGPGAQRRCRRGNRPSRAVRPARTPGGRAALCGLAAGARFSARSWVKHSVVGLQSGPE